MALRSRLVPLILVSVIRIGILLECRVTPMGLVRIGRALPNMCSWKHAERLQVLPAFWRKKWSADRDSCSSVAQILMKFTHFGLFSFAENCQKLVAAVMRRGCQRPDGPIPGGGH